jgi:hypothetical protein
VRALRDRIRVLAFFTPWVSVPLAFLGVVTVLTYPLLLITPLAWICVPVAIVAAILLALYLRPRYRLAILDSSPLGVFYWLQRRT